MASSCCICLCVLNNEEGLPFVLKNIDKLREEQVFKNLQILVYYDKSTDSSLNILKNYQLQNHSLVIYENLEPLNAPRTERIAHARNGLLKMLRENFSHYEYFAMMDSNNYSCVGKIRPYVLAQMLERYNEWDSISFDREAGYYDHWALSYDPFIYSFFHFQNWRDAVAKLRNDFGQRLEYQRRNNPNGLIRVYSAFNGFSLYKMSHFIECSYSSDIKAMAFPQGLIQKHCNTIGQNIIPQYRGDCEHRFFHLDSIRRKNSRVCISLLSLFGKSKEN
jgi:hypothetical protein